MLGLIILLALFISGLMATRAIEKSLTIPNWRLVFLIGTLMIYHILITIAIIMSTLTYITPRMINGSIL